MEEKDLQSQFLEFRPQLHSYLFRLTTHRQEAEDLLQDTYLKAFAKLDSFKGKSSFKTWVFSIATNLVRDSRRAQERWGEDWMNLAKDAHMQSPALMAKKMEVSRTSPHGTFVMSEHLNYCFNCTSKTLLLNNQICLWLKEVYEFKVAEIMLIAGLTEGKVKHAIAEARKDMVRIFEKKCALINKEGICGQCTGLNRKFNPAQDIQIEANKLKIVKERRNKNYGQLLELRLQMVKAIDPLDAEGRDLHGYLIENSPAWAKAQKAVAKK